MLQANAEKISFFKCLVFSACPLSFSDSETDLSLFDVCLCLMNQLTETSPRTSIAFGSLDCTAQSLDAGFAEKRPVMHQTCTSR